MCRCLSSVIVLSDGTSSARCSHSASSLFGEFIDPLVAGVALLVSELLAQLQDLGAQRPVGSMQLNFIEAGAPAVPRHAAILAIFMIS
jgi:hypothetical protein